MMFSVDSIPAGGVLFQGSQQLFHFGGAEEAFVDFDDCSSGGGVDAFFLQSGTFPAQFYAGAAECQSGELAHAVVFAGGNHKVVGCVLLQNQPHAFHIVGSVTPVAASVQIAQIEFVLASGGDGGGGKGDFACNEVFAAAFALVVEEYAVGGVHAIAFAVVAHYPEGVLLGHCIWRTGMERCGLALWNFLDFAEEFGGRCLV